MSRHLSEYLLTITAPTGWISSNQHQHWRNRHRLTAAWREAAAWQARKAHLPALGAGPVHITATIHKTTRHIYDLDGAAPTIKAAIDGIRDAGCLGGDDWRFIPKLTIEHGEPWADAALVLRIEVMEAAA